MQAVAQAHPFAGIHFSKKSRFALMFGFVALLALFATTPTFALDLVAFTGITGPLTSALTTLGTITPGIKAIVGVVGFVVAMISLAALRNLGPVLFFMGLAIFGSVGLTIAGAILGAQI